MGEYGQRETILRADAMQWRERVSADMTSAAGRAALIEHRISAEAVAAAADRIASYVAAGGVLIEMCSGRARRAAEFLEARRMIERIKGDLVRPIGIRAGA